jgi:hypothetical protein
MRLVKTGVRAAYRGCACYTPTADEIPQTVSIAHASSSSSTLPSSWDFGAARPASNSSLTLLNNAVPAGGLLPCNHGCLPRIIFATLHASAPCYHRAPLTTRVRTATAATTTALAKPLFIAGAADDASSPCARSGCSTRVPTSRRAADAASYGHSRSRAVPSNASQRLARSRPIHHQLPCIASAARLASGSGRPAAARRSSPVG